MPFADSTRHEYAVKRLFEPQILIEDSTGVFLDNAKIIGQYLDKTEDSALSLQQQLFPDDCTAFLTDYERIYQLSAAGSDENRQARIISAHRARGGLSSSYFEELGNVLGDGTYTVTCTDGTGGIPFIIHTYSSVTDPKGPATLLPGALYEEATGTTPYQILCDVTGTTTQQDDLESLFNRLKPAHCDWIFNYTA